MKKKSFLGTLFLVFVLNFGKAQCLQVESILVDACVTASGCTSTSGPCNCEGRNEMVLFKVGASSVNTNSLTATWPFNPFRGWAQNANTAANIATLNATIASCGFLKEPVGDTLPANSEVLVITSWDMCTGANSFTNLQDTLIVLFQDTGNFQGHFANHNNGGTVTSVPSGTVSLRSLTLTYAPLSCTQTVTYDRSQLVNNLGTYGGSAAQNDGSTVLFDTLGNPTYVNNGCQAPYIPILTDAGANDSICYNDTLNLNGAVTGPFLSYAWSGGTGSFTNASSLNSGYIPGLGESGIVTLYLTAQGKCSSGGVVDSLLLTILPGPTPLISANANTVCAGSNLVLSVNAQSGTTYTLNPGAISGISFTVSPATQTIYTVNATNSCGSASDTFQVNVNSLPAVSILNDTICSGDSATLSASGASTYTWNTGATGASISGVLSATTQFSVAGTDANGCVNTANGLIFVYPLPLITVSSASICPGATATLTASGASTYTWSTGQNGDSISVTLSSSASFIVKGKDANGCENTVIATVTVYGLPPVSIANADVCPGGSTDLTASGALTYTWSTMQTGDSITVSPSTPTNYTVIGTDANGCVNSAVTTVTINPLPVITVNSPATCPGVNTTLNALGANTYTWSGGQNGSSINVPGTVASYTVTGTDTNGCVNTAVSSVSLLALPAVQTVSGDSVICLNGSGTLSVTAGTYTYTWAGPGGVIGNGVSVPVNQAGVYTVTATNNCGSTSSQFTVTISTPQAGFSPNVATGLTPATFSFTNSSLGTQLSNYWNFFNGDTSTMMHPVVTYTAEGSYPVILIVTDLYGCMDTASYTVFVTDTIPPMVIPNIFSPNDDNINDLFMIIGTRISSFNCRVFDRWGLLLYEWNDIKGGWNGKNASNGLAAADGTYYFIVTYTNDRGDFSIKPGFVQLIR